MKSRALIYRPQTWEDVTEQSETVAILKNQIESGEVLQGYCFVGAAGTGKTTCARIFANEINKGQGSPIEMDAASNNSVDDVREIIKMAQTKSIDSEYKVFLLDEVHMFSQGAWNALLKVLEEPPAKTIFILCTTDYWKIPKTVMSRAQRYDFKRISIEGMKDRLQYIFLEEFSDNADYYYEKEALDFIARQSDGCMREAITNLDKCLAYSDRLSIDNVLKALNLSDYGTFMELTDHILYDEKKEIVEVIEKVYSDGQDLKQFIKSYMNFILDILKYKLTKKFEFTALPKTDEMVEYVEDLSKADAEEPCLDSLLSLLISIDSDIKWSQSPKTIILAKLFTF